MTAGFILSPKNLLGGTKLDSKTATPITPINCILKTNKYFGTDFSSKDIIHHSSFSIQKL